MLLNCIVQTIAIAAYAARLAAVQSGRVATAISLYNIFATGSRFAQVLYTPLLGSLSDRASASATLGPAAHAAVVGSFVWQLRWILIAGAVGSAIGTLALPAFVRLYIRAIRVFERVGSIPRAILKAFVPRTFVSIFREVRFARRTSRVNLSVRNLPKELFVVNLVVTAIYAVGIVSAAYASVLHPQAARTALLSSGLVNGLAAIAYNVAVDPVSALITDQAARGDRSVSDVKALVIYLALTAIIGFIASQALLVPAAQVLALAAKLISGR